MIARESRRWEHGSDFHWFFEPRDLLAPEKVWPESRMWMGSGRDALRQASDIGSRRAGWTRAWVPDFLCQEVVADLAEVIETASYPCDPWGAAQLPGGLSKRDVVVSVPYFGMQVGPAREDAFGLIEDHTHDPWSQRARESNADLCIASLRKTLPIPEGGVVWSPAGWPLPEAPPVSATRERAAARKRSGMLLKAAYLAGANVSKQAFLDLFALGESEIAEGATSGMTTTTRELVGLLPVSRWQAQRRRGHEILTNALRSVSWLTPLEARADMCPFAFIALVEDEERRTRVRRELIRRDVYPPVLWPLEKTCVPVRERARELSRRMLVVHCDARYEMADLERVAALILGAGK